MTVRTQYDTYMIFIYAFVYVGLLYLLQRDPCSFFQPLLHKHLQEATLERR